MSGLASAIEELATEDVAAVDDDALACDLMELRRRIDQLEFQFVRRVRAFDRREVWRRDGAVSTGAWLRTHCRLAPGAAHGRVAVARRLDRDLPTTAAAFAAGDVSFRAHAHMIVAATGDVPPERSDETEAALVDSARELDVQAFRDVVADWRHAFDAGAARLEARRAKARCRFTLRRTARGTSVLDGELDAEGAATLSSALDAVGPPPRGPALLRTPAQRRAEALVELARRVLDGGPARVNRGARPHLNVTVPLAAIPTALRRAIVARDRHCIFPACDRPPPWADVYHFVHWADGGETSLDNCGLCCRPHHWLFHEGGWSIRRGADGRVEVMRPGGRPLVPP